MEKKIKRKPLNTQLWNYIKGRYGFRSKREAEDYVDAAEVLHILQELEFMESSKERKVPYII